VSFSNDRSNQEGSIKEGLILVVIILLLLGIFHFIGDFDSGISRTVEQKSTWQEPTQTSEQPATSSEKDNGSFLGSNPDEEDSEDLDGKSTKNAYYHPLSPEEKRAADAKKAAQEKAAKANQ